MMFSRVAASAVRRRALVSATKAAGRLHLGSVTQTKDNYACKKVCIYVYSVYTVGFSFIHSFIL